MHGQQRLLYHVLDLFWAQPISREAALRQPAQKRRKLSQNAAIRIRVAAASGSHQLREMRVLIRHAATTPDTHTKAAALQPARRIIGSRGCRVH
jgi:hypothetical protein